MGPPYSALTGPGTLFEKKHREPCGRSVADIAGAPASENERWPHTDVVSARRIRFDAPRFNPFERGAHVQRGRGDPPDRTPVLTAHRPAAQGRQANPDPGRRGARGVRPRSAAPARGRVDG